MTTMKRARKVYGSQAVEARAGAGFRAWARATYAGQALEELSPKLRKIVDRSKP